MSQFELIGKKVEDLCRRHNADRLFMLTDTHVAPLVEELLPDVPRLVIEAGEESKSVEGLCKVWNFLVESRALRRSVLVNVGGGMISDLGGFAAATFKRGISCINLPTTLLSAVDAAIGGKTGINFKGLKNEVGAFSMPLAVFPLTSLFSDLPDPEWLSGVGEAIKTGMLDSEELFNLATSEEFIVKRNQRVVDEVVARCAAFKSRIVEEDFKESGLRKILNLGHTAGHAIEAWCMAEGKPVPHGIAVAHGLLATLRMSRDRGLIGDTLVERYSDILNRYFPPLQMTPADWEQAAQYMAHDKKNKVEGRPEWVLIKGIGCPVV